MLLFIALTILLLLLSLFFCLYSWPSSRNRRMLSMIPGYSEIESWSKTFKAAALPVEGVKDFLENIFGHFPSICSIWFLGRPNVNVSSPDNIEVVLKSIQNISKGNEYFMFTDWLGEGLLTSSGAKWHANRKLLTPAFHFKILESCIPIFNSNASLMVKLLKDRINQNGETLIVEHFISLCSLDIVSEAAMGVLLGAQLHNKSTIEYVNAVRRMGELCLRRVKSFYLENKWLYSLTPAGREQTRLLKVLHNFTESVILGYQGTELQRVIKKSKEKRYKEKSRGVLGHQKAAFVDFLLEMAENEPGVFTDVEIRQEVDTFMFEGHETTTSSICWSLLLLGHDADIQEKVFSELVAIFDGSDRPVTSQDLAKMTYLEAVIKESMRLYPPVSYMSRKLDSDLLIENYSVPRGTNVIIIPYFLHRQEQLYPDPETFNPDRFLKVDNVNRHPFMYIPFSGGPRNCIGQRFAMMEMKVVLTYILRTFKLTSVTRREGIKILFSPILRPMNGTCVKMNARS